VWSNDRKKNLFEDPKGELGVSKLGYHFLGGLIHHAAAMCAITNPTVNSYKRINAPRTLSGATWSPSSITYGGNNRTHMVRIPDAGRAEYRLPDGAANPYLLLAATSPSGSVTQRWTADQGGGVRPSISCANFGMSMLPPERITPTRFPFMVSRSLISAASGAAPAPSAMVWQQRK
jgi:hypothetical protein